MEFNLFTISKKGVLFKSYEIVGETQADYKVKSEGLFFKTMVFYDHNGAEVLRVNRSTKLLKREYEIVRNGSAMAHIKQYKNIPKPRLAIRSDMGNYEIVGNFFRSDFTIMKDTDEVAKISRRQMKSQGYLGVAINDDQDHEFILALVMLIEMNIREQQAAAG